eukprot:6430738-Prymnesium_polylepis.1
MQPCGSWGRSRVAYPTSHPGSGLIFLPENLSCHIGDRTNDSAVIGLSGEGSRVVLGSIPNGVRRAETA